MVIDLKKYKSPTGELDLALALNSEPDPKWVKKHPFLKKAKPRDNEPHEYIPASVCAQILDALFGFMYWDLHIKESREIGANWEVTISLTVRTPNGLSKTVEGIGAESYQIAKATGEVQSGALMMAVGKAKSTAFKNAAKMMGRIFGGELDKDISFDLVGTALEKEKPKEEITRNHQNWDELCIIASTGKTSKGREIAGGVKAFLSKYQFASLEDLEHLFSLEEARKAELLPVTQKLDEASKIKFISSKSEADKKVWASIYNSVKTGKTSKGNIATVDGILEHYAFSDADLAHLLALEASRISEEAAKQTQTQAVKEAVEDNEPPF